jgi:hypothetical protein
MSRELRLELTEYRESGYCPECGSRVEVRLDENVFPPRIEYRCLDKNCFMGSRDG